VQVVLQNATVLKYEYTTEIMSSKIMLKTILFVWLLSVSLYGF